MRGLRQVFDKFEGEGTVFGSISKNDFHAIERPVPPSELIEAFERLANPFDGRIAANIVESESLAALRDTLLPKLISGELRVTTRSEEL
jgi:type I restriction enzyme S subunit